MDSPRRDGPWPALLETAVLAPSPHNVQPWRVRIEDEARAELLIEKGRTLPKEDVEGSFIVLTMGLLVEALRLAAAHRGLALDDETVADLDADSAANLQRRPAEFIPFARLTLRPDPAVRPEVDLALFETRRTSRLSYGPEPVAPEHGAALARLAEQWERRYAQLTDPPRIERILAMNIEAAFEDLNHAPYREELRGWLRYTEAESMRHRDGLDARCMNQAPLELWAAFHVPTLLRWKATRPWFARRYRAQIGPVATMGFLCGPFWPPRDAYRTGRFLMRFWLECTRLGYYLHPYGNLVTNRPVAARVEAETGLKDVWLAFKIGRSAPPPRSRRRSVAEILL